MRAEELVSSNVILGELNADIRISQTRPNLLPTPGTGDMVPQPRREPFKPVLLVGSSGGIVTAIGSRNYEREDKDNKEDSDEECHKEEVNSQETLLVPVCTHEASKSNKEDEDSEDHNGPPEVLDALVVWF